MPKPFTTRLVEWAMAAPFVVLGGLALAGVFGYWPRVIVAVPMAILYTGALIYGIWRFATYFRQGWPEGGKARRRHG